MTTIVQMTLYVISRGISIFLSAFIIRLLLSAHRGRSADVEWSTVPCPEKWVNFEKSCYLPVREAPVRWHEALKRCNESSAHLVSVNALPEAIFLSNLLTEVDLARKIWLTSGYLTTDGSYEWSGDGSKFSFYFWHQNEHREHGFVAYSYSDDAYRWSTVKSIDSGYFVCEIDKSRLYKLPQNILYNDFGLSPSETLDKPKAPRFLEEPSDTISFSNGPFHWVELRCLAEANPPATYRWYKGSSGRYVDPTNCSNMVQIDGNLIIVDTEITKDKDYYCTASNEHGTIRSRKISLNSAYLKDFDAGRLDVYASEGAGKSLPCLAPEHFPESTNFGWMYETVKQFLTETQRIFIAGDGALYFSHLIKNDQKKYSCTIFVINEFQAGRYGPFFTLKVVDGTKAATQEAIKPNIPDEFPRIYPKNAQQGKSAWMECFAYGKPAPTYRWERLDNSFNDNKTVIKNFGRKLYFDSLSYQDAGTYRCIAENSRGNTTKEISLTVQSSPTFLTTLEDITVEINGSVTLMCEAFGSPRVDYEWFRNGRPLNSLLLPFDDQGRIVIDYNRLTIKRTELRDTGSYQCFASNKLGQVSTSSNVIVKNFGATLAKHPTNRIVYAFTGTTVELSCPAEGLPTPTISWHFDSRSITFGWQYAITKEKNLKIIQVAHDVGGLYTCSAINLYGTTSLTIELKVLSSLKLELEPSVSVIRENATVLCKSKSDTCVSCVDVPLEWSFNCHNSKQFQSFSSPISNNGTSKISISTPNDYFTGILTCKSESPNGHVAIATAINFDRPPLAPVQVKAYNSSQRSIWLTWKIPYEKPEEITIAGYKILARIVSNESNDWETIRNFIAYSPVSVEHYYLENSLLPNTNYEFSILSRNRIGWSRFGVLSNEIRTLFSFPFGIIQNVKATFLRPGQILVEWEPLAKSKWGADHVGYVIEWSLLNVANTSHSSVSVGDSGARDYVIRILDANPNECSNYSIQVRAFNDNGRGPAADPVYIVFEKIVATTAITVNTIDYPVWVDVLNESSVNISWDVQYAKVSQNECYKLLAYKLLFWANENDNVVSGAQLVPIDVYSCLVKNLLSDTVYNFQIMPILSAGSVNASQIVSAKTYRRAPSKAPSGVKVKNSDNFKDEFVEISWDRVATVSANEEPLESYKIHLWEASTSYPYTLDVFANDISQSLPLVRLEHLKRFRQYKLQIQTYSQGGYGPMSDPVIFRFGI